MSIKVNDPNEPMGRSATTVTQNQAQETGIGYEGAKRSDTMVTAQNETSQAQMAQPQSMVQSTQMAQPPSMVQSNQMAKPPS